MFKTIKRYISVFLCLIFMFPSTVHAYSNEALIGVNDSFFVGGESASVEEQEMYVKEFISKMTPEAQEILFDYFAQEEPELYNKYIDAATSSVQSRSAVRSNSPENEARAAAVNGVAALGRNLRAIGLAGAAYSLFMSVGAEISATLAGAGITVGGLVAILLAAVAFAVIVSNWDTIEKKYGDIIKAFQNAFPRLSGVISAAFGKCKSKYAQAFNDAQTTKLRFRDARLLDSVGKHIDKAFVTQFIRNSSNRENKIFYSTENRVSLITMKISKGNKASLNKRLSSTSKYDVKNYDLGGFTMYLLYDCKTNEIYHCHVRLIGDDTIKMRRKNRLDWMVYPERKRDMKYYGSVSPLELDDIIIP